MPTAKDLILRPITRQEADAVVKRLHYSGKVVNNSQIHMGAFLNGRLEGAMQFGPSLDKRKLQGLVEGTAWNEFIELNRMAFSEALPRNSESRALSVAMRLLRKHAPHLKWVVSFADGCQCGDGTIYRAAGFVLTGINSDVMMLRLPSGEVVHRLTFGDKGSELSRQYLGATAGSCVGIKKLQDATGAERVRGHQLRYLYFLDPAARERLTVPVLPFSEIERRGAGMYRGKPTCERSAVSGTALPRAGGGATPTRSLEAVGT